MKQQDIEKLDKIRDYYKEHGIMPTMREIADMVDHKSTNSIWKFIERMIKINRIKKVGGGGHQRIAPGELFHTNIA